MKEIYNNNSTIEVFFLYNASESIFKISFSQISYVINCLKVTLVIFVSFRAQVNVKVHITKPVAVF